jgi:hypothetical protein
MTRVPCYIGAPYAASTPREIEENVRRALQLGRWAVAAGFAPIVPHALGAAELYGCAKEQDDGTSRRVALECGVAGARMVAAISGVFLAIRRDDGSLSSGTQAEFDAYLVPARTTVLFNLGTWEHWEHHHEVILSRLAEEAGTPRRPSKP